MSTAVPSRGLNGRGVKLTTHFHLVLRLRMSEAIPLLPLTPSWRGHFTLHTSNRDVPVHDMKTHRDMMVVGLRPGLFTSGVKRIDAH